MGRTSRDSSRALRGEDGDQAVWPTGGSGLGAHARACELVEPGGDLLFDHPAESADAERFRDFGRGPSAFGVVRTTEQPNSKAVCVEVHSTRPAELAKACGAALLSSFRCLTPEARITTTLFVKRTTKARRRSSQLALA